MPEINQKRKKNVLFIGAQNIVFPVVTAKLNAFSSYKTCNFFYKIESE